MTALGSGEKFQEALDRLNTHLRKRCDAAKSLTESMIEEDHPKSADASLQFLHMVEELHVFNKLVQLVSVMARDLNVVVEREKNTVKGGAAIEVVELPGAMDRSSDGEDLN